MMNRICAHTAGLSVLAIAFSTIAWAESSRILVETFHMPMADWVRIPAALRDNDQELHRKLKGAAGRSGTRLADRIGGAFAGKAVSFQAENSLRYPENFTTNGRMLMPDRWIHRDIGSSFDMVPGKDGKETSPSFFYSWTPAPTAFPEMIDDGSADDMRRSRTPVFETIYLRVTPGIRVGTPILLGAVPVPCHTGKSDQLAIMFGHCHGLQENGPADEPAFRMEFLILRGISGKANDASTTIRSLIAQKGGLESVAVLSLKAGTKASVDSGSEWMFPTSAIRRGEVIVPQNLETIAIGTTVECESPTADGDEFQFAIRHSLRKPDLPVATAKAGGSISPRTVSQYEAVAKSRVKLLPEIWQLVEEIPLEPILGRQDLGPKNQSCHIFVRLKKDLPPALNPIPREE